MSTNSKDLAPWLVTAAFLGIAVVEMFCWIHANAELAKREALLTETQDDLKEVAKEKADFEQSLYDAVETGQNCENELKQLFDEHRECESRMPKFLKSFSSNECCFRFSQCLESVDRFLTNTEEIRQRYDDARNDRAEEEKP